LSIGKTICLALGQHMPDDNQDFSSDGGNRFVSTNAFSQSFDLPPLFGPLLMLDSSPETAPGTQPMLLELVADSPVNCVA
jgi:hypothetical protein